MSERTWVCVPCGKSYRRRQDVEAVRCAHCHGECEQVHWKIRIPSPKNRRAWDKFWVDYRAEKALVKAWQNGELRENVLLPILRMQLHVKSP